MNAAQPFLENLSSQADRTAIVEPGGRSITYGGLHRRIAGLADELCRQGMEPGDRVVLQIPNGIAFAATALAVLLGGGVPVLIEPGLGDEVYLSRVRVSAPRFLIVHPLILRIRRVPGLASVLRRAELDVPPVPPVTGGLRRIVVDVRRLDGLARRAGDDPALASVERSAGDDAILIFTGGTTDMPKGVRLSHGAVGDYISNISSAISGLACERFVADTPQQVLYALRLGKTAHVTKGRKQKRARIVMGLLREAAVDAYFGSPYVWMEMRAQAGPSPEPLPDSMKTVLLGGAPVTPDFLALLRAWLPDRTHVMVLYGMTEVGPVCVVRAEDKLRYEGEGDLVGKPLPGVRIEIDPIPGAEEGVGEVVVHSPSLYTGYLGQPDRPPEEGLRTGDVGRRVTVDGEEMLSLLGRGKDMIIRNGVNIYPLSFEPRIRALAGSEGDRLLRECALVGVWNPTRQDEDVVLCVEPSPGATLDMDRLRRHAERVCGTDAKPDHYLLVEPIPVTGRQNKVDKKALRAHCADRLGYPSAGEFVGQATRRGPGLAAR